MGQRDQMGMMWLWWLLLIVGVVAVIVGLVLARRAGSGSGRGDTTSEHSPARQILDERLARGEIAEEEYRTRREERHER
jgi:putative membrane protein